MYKRGSISASLSKFKVTNPANFSIEEKIIYCVLIVLALQALGCIPSPFVNHDYAKYMIGYGDAGSLPAALAEYLGAGSAFGIWDAMTGHGLSKVSLMALSITPYITASIVMQLLSVSSQRVSDIMQDKTAEGAKTRWKVNAVLSAILALAEGAAIAYGYSRQGIFTGTQWYVVPVVAVYWAIGTALSVFAGWIMTTKVIGEGSTLNGISLILLSNILSSYASDTVDIYRSISVTSSATWQMAVKAVVVVIAFIFIFTLVTAGQMCEKRLTVTSPNNMKNSKIPSAYTSGYPIKLWSGSVVPVIFASQIFSIPGIIRSVSGNGSKVMNVIANIFDTTSWFSTTHPFYTAGAVLYALAIIGFSFYYANISANPVEVAKSMRDHSQTIPGIRPGKPTADYIKRQTYYVTLIGGIALSLIALIPCVLGGLMGISRVGYLGTSVLITVGVIIDIRDYIRSYVMYKKERGFLHHGKENRK